ncbi:MAG: DUF559 domain-containing protein [Candidatus Sungbacteria bacterium]|nr:DUF559 domain-containing protein [Candidatus Sungbacteria bacterium]
MAKIDKEKEMALVGVLKRKSDLEILLHEHWYRMPADKSPRRKFNFLAFYEPARFGPGGKQIKYYARALRIELKKRLEILPEEIKHPAAGKEYQKVWLGRIQKLKRPIRNMPPRRVSFGFATLGRLKTARNILELYRVAPTESIIERALRRAGIIAIPQYRISSGGKRYSLDFAVLCRKGKIAVECDNRKAHSGRRQLDKDKTKNRALKRIGWVVMHLMERDIVSDLNKCVSGIKKKVVRFGGQGLF